MVIDTPGPATDDFLRRYVDQVASELPGTRVMFMQSNGGLTDARDALRAPQRRHAIGRVNGQGCG